MVTLRKKINFSLCTVLKKASFHINKCFVISFKKIRRKEIPRPRFIQSCQSHRSIWRGNYVGAEGSRIGLWIQTQSFTHRRHNYREIFSHSHFGLSGQKCKNHCHSSFSLACVFTHQEPQGPLLYKMPSVVVIDIKRSMSTNK